MRGYRPVDSFGPEAAASYDDYLRGDEEDAVAFLVSLAGEGPALELAIGTGRIALPLAERGIAVTGIDLSSAMLEQLKRKPGGGGIPVVLGDFAEVPVEGTFRLIYIVFNTFHNLLTQEEQVRCFENVAKHLADDGVFVIEAGLPNEFFGRGVREYVNVDAVEVHSVTFDVATYDVATQLLTENHVTISEEGPRFGPIVTRYCWTSELDLMARIAGLRVRERWSSWKRDPFDARSIKHISVFGR
ncbi:MAG: class I SAM-dependent methyltransferase [Thermomicrobiales bacterium]|nr:class I SAM-dependent methyltransferase [Thermomicrobiales bacterium]